MHPDHLRLPASSAFLHQVEWNGFQNSRCSPRVGSKTVARSNVIPRLYFIPFGEMSGVNNLYKRLDKKPYKRELKKDRSRGAVLDRKIDRLHYLPGGINHFASAFTGE